MSSALPLLLGLIWVALDPRKQGWHDKLAGTVVVSAVTSAVPGRYAPTSALTYLLCAPILLFLLALLVVVFAAGFDPASLRALNPPLG